MVTSWTRSKHGSDVKMSSWTPSTMIWVLQKWFQKWTWQCWSQSLFAVLATALHSERLHFLSAPLQCHFMWTFPLCRRWLPSANGGKHRSWIWGAVAVCEAKVALGCAPDLWCLEDANGNCGSGWISHTACCDGACWSIMACQRSHSMPNEGVCDNVEDKLFLSHQLILALLGDLSSVLLATSYKAAG